MRINHWLVTYPTGNIILLNKKALNYFLAPQSNKWYVAIFVEKRFVKLQLRYKTDTEIAISIHISNRKQPLEISILEEYKRKHELDEI